MMVKWLAVMMLLSWVTVLGAASGTPGSLNVGFIYVGPVGDYGWSSPPLAQP
jgi:basic membrane lipoprotein Med (substrate-binding protein (PBP1-ABC) superfamily)